MSMKVSRKSRSGRHKRVVKVVCTWFLYTAALFQPCFQPYAISPIIPIISRHPCHLEALSEVDLPFTCELYISPCSDELPEQAKKTPTCIM
ncbi:hypothetical protein M426DRAFT_177700 [Hypoxylon sp. CI-4A]|nr:hypothetical protein M426DRAFT_177700 [Hypoxylon sp. CI-4A]